ncbi:DUF7683 domain-containing protein [Streptomyces huiliensis]|uniref:DUF7683 domain-containing protein n=1 Tax=Streptomyces huiliensis TaxID=2876027 RepID=UPI001CBDA4E0|nr:hypothetical protein [Streptomyces huiliensis]MBZ4322747.1 hypothetical protein [Streptomyces huiliensis]
MKYLVTAYDKKSEEFAGEATLSGVSPEFLADLVGVPVGQLLNAYPLDESRLMKIAEKIDLKWDVGACDYFLEVVGE